MQDEWRAVRTSSDTEVVRRQARDLARANGLSVADAECVALAASELATNLVRYARGGRIRVSFVQRAEGRWLEIECVDQGPGILDMERALQDGYSTGGGLGSGLPSVRRLMDEFEIQSGPAGTHVWARKHARAA